MKLILTREVAGPRPGRRHRRGRRRLRPQLPRPARRRHRLDQGRREADRADQARARRPRDPRPRPRPRDQGRPREAVGHARRPRRRGRPAVRLDHRGRRRRAPSRPPAARCWTASASSCPATSRRPARTPSPSTCTRTSSPRCRSTVDRAAELTPASRPGPAPSRVADSAGVVRSACATVARSPRTVGYAVPARDCVRRTIFRPQAVDCTQGPRFAGLEARFGQVVHSVVHSVCLQASAAIPTGCPQRSSTGELRSPAAGVGHSVAPAAATTPPRARDRRDS